MGKHLRTKKKEIRELTKEREKAKLQAEYHFFFKNSRGWKLYLKRWFDSVKDKLDPLELISITGVTVIIKNGIEWTEKIIEQQAQFVNLFAGILKVPKIDITILEKAMDTPQAEMLQWLISFSIAYLIVHNFGAIMSAGGNLVAAAVKLIGAAGAAA